MDKLITHLLVLSLFVHVSLELEGGSPGAVLGAVVEVVTTGGRCGGHGCGRWCWIAGSVGGSTGKLDGTFQCLAQSALCIDVVKILVCLVRL